MSLCASRPRVCFPFTHALTQNILKQEPKNYNALVFLGLGLFKGGNPAQSEEAYQRAISAEPQQLLAFQVAS
jgi:cytochrome c-type biogenesis protein CcmH/NrfG